MSDTPRTDKRIEEIKATPSDGFYRFQWLADHARELERELAQIKAQPAIVTHHHYHYYQQMQLGGAGGGAGAPYREDEAIGQGGQGGTRGPGT